MIDDIPYEGPEDPKRATETPRDRLRCLDWSFSDALFLKSIGIKP